MNSRREDKPLNYFKTMLETDHPSHPTRKHLEINPTYQRETVWSLPQKEMLMNSLILKIPIPELYIWEKNPSKNFEELDVVDGKQRITTVVDYLNDKFALGEDIDPAFASFQRKKYSELGASDQNDVSNMNLSIVYLQNAQDEDIEDLFLRHNSGTSLNAAEKRRGLNSVTDLVKIITNIAETNPIFVNSILVKKYIARLPHKRWGYEDTLSKIFHLLFVSTNDGLNNDIDLDTLFKKGSFSASSIEKTYRNSHIAKTKITDTHSTVVSMTDSIDLIKNCFNTCTDTNFSKTEFITHCVLLKYLNKSYDLKKTHDLCPPLTQLKTDIDSYREEEKDPSKKYSGTTDKNELQKYLETLRSDRTDHLQYRFTFLCNLYIENQDLEHLAGGRIFSTNQKDVLLRKQKFKCKTYNNNPNCITDVKRDNSDADHKTPWAKKGKTTISNGQILCKDCHQKKTADQQFMHST